MEIKKFMYDFYPQKIRKKDLEKIDWELVGKFEKALYDLMVKDEKLKGEAKNKHFESLKVYLPDENITTKGVIFRIVNYIKTLTLYKFTSMDPNVKSFISYGELLKEYNLKYPNCSTISIHSQVRSLCSLMRIYIYKHKEGLSLEEFNKNKTELLELGKQFQNLQPSSSRFMTRFCVFVPDLTLAKKSQSTWISDYLDPIRNYITKVEDSTPELKSLLEEKPFILENLSAETIVDEIVELTQKRVPIFEEKILASNKATRNKYVQLLQGTCKNTILERMKFKQDLYK